MQDRAGLVEKITLTILFGREDEEGGAMASRSKSWEFCDVLKGKKRGYIHRERGAKGI